MNQEPESKCVANCGAAIEPGHVFCLGCWSKLPRAVRQFLLAEQKSARRARRGWPGKRWETTVREAIEHLHQLELDESLARAKPLTLTADKGWLSRLADQVLGRAKYAGDFVVVVRPDAPEAPAVDGERVFVRDLASLRTMLLASR